MKTKSQGPEDRAKRVDEIEREIESRTHSKMHSSAMLCYDKLKNLNEVITMIKFDMRNGSVPKAACLILLDFQSKEIMRVHADLVALQKESKNEK